MKFITIIFAALILLTACSSHKEVQTQHLDLRAVEEYRSEVYSDNTVPDSERTLVKPVEIPLNYSDNHPKYNNGAGYNRGILFAPSIGYGYGRGYGRYGHGYW